MNPHLLTLSSLRRGPLAALIAALGALLLVLAAAAPASAELIDENLEISPPGANDWGCQPSAVHPNPVILVPGTFESMAKNWSTLAPVLKSQGYCVYSLNYGETNGVPATAPVKESAAELSVFVDRVLESTGAKQVDLVGHSQGGMMPRWYIGFLGGATKVDSLIGIAPSSHGTQGVIVPAGDGDGTALSSADDGLLYELCAACIDQQAGSSFMQELNAIGDIVQPVDYTVISTRYDEVVTPYTSQFLDGREQDVTNLLIQDYCPLDPIEHDQAPNDPVVHQMVANALLQDGPADPSFQPVCGPDLLLGEQAL